MAEIKRKAGMILNTDIEEMIQLKNMISQLQLQCFRCTEISDPDLKIYQKIREQHLRYQSGKSGRKYQSEIRNVFYFYMEKEKM